MSLTSAQINVFYEELLARQATQAEEAAYVALSQTQTTADVEQAIETLPEVANLVDPVIRLYQGAFGRVPDTAGTFGPPSPSGFWVNVNALRNGLSLQNLAEAFVASAEFKALYGTTSVTPALIQAFYHNILGRDATSAEVSSWANSGLDAAHILIGFTQSVEFIADSTPAALAFKTEVLNGQNPVGSLGGQLPPPPPLFTLSSDHDGSGTANEGQSITYTLQGPISAAGQTYSYTITGVTPGQDITGGLTGSVTLDALGLAHIVVTTIADQKTDGPLPMTLTVAQLSDTVTILNTSLTPAIQNFTPVVGETLVGGPAATNFQGTVDTVIVGNNTLSNIVDVAQGNAGFHNKETIIIDNSSGTNITPKSTGVQEMVVTNLDASGGKGGMTNIDSQFMHDVTTVTSFGSTKGLNVFNLQNFISTINIEQSDVPGGLNFNVTMIDGTVGGRQAINLDHAGLAGGGTFLSDETTSGNDVVKEFDISSFGMNKITIDGTSVATTFRVADTGSGNDVTTVVSVDDTEALTLIDTTLVAGTVSMWGFEVETGNTLQVNEGGGTNTFGISVEGNGTLNVDGTAGGTDTLFAHFNTSDGVTDGGTIVVTEGNGSDTLDVDNTSGGNSQTVTATYGSGANNLNVETGNSSTVTLTAGIGSSAHANTVAVTTLDDSSVSVSLGSGGSNVTVGDGERSKVTVTAQGGANTVTINTNDPGQPDPVADNDGHQVYSVTLGAGTDHVTMAVFGSDPEIGPFGDDHGTGDIFNVHKGNGEPDSVVASNQTITVALGDGGTVANNQTATIETGVNSAVTLTSGNGVDNIQINADNDLWSMDSTDTVATFVGEGGSQIKVNTGDGNKTITVNTDATGFDAISGKWLDKGSSIQIATGNGDDKISVIIGTAGQGNSVNVSAGAGNDRVQLDAADIGTSITLDGGAGIDTLALVSASAGASAAALANVANFEILEVTNVLANSVDLDNYEPANNINHVILDAGFHGTQTISGAEQNFQLDLLAGSPGQTLNVLVDNALINTNDAIGIKLDAGNAGATSFGTVVLDTLFTGTAVETVSIDSTSTNALATVNNLKIIDEDLGGGGLHTLNILHDAGGDVSLNLDGSFVSFNLATVQAATFTGGITWDDGGIGDNSITFNAPVSGNDSLVFGNGNDTVTLGGGSNNVTFGHGSDSYSAGNGTNNVTFNTTGGNTDNVVLGSGTDTVTFNGTGGSGSSVSFLAHAGTDTVNFTHVAESQFSLPDTITGFQAGTDTLHFTPGMFSGSGFSFVTVSSQVAVLAAIAGDSSAHPTFVYDLSTGHLYIDGDHNQTLTTAGTHDMEIALTGIPHITSANILIS